MVPIQLSLGHTQSIYHFKIHWLKPMLNYWLQAVGMEFRSMEGLCLAQESLVDAFSPKMIELCIVSKIRFILYRPW